MGDRKNIKTVVAWNTSRRTITLCKSNEKYFFLLFCCMTFSHFQSNENPFKMTQKKTENWFHYFWLSCFIVFVWHGYGVFFYWFVCLFHLFSTFLLELYAPHIPFTLLRWKRVKTEAIYIFEYAGSAVDDCVGFRVMLNKLINTHISDVFYDILLINVSLSYIDNK